MPQRSLAFIILGGIEIIVSLRVLFFCLPVLINNYRLHVFSSNIAADGFIVISTISSIVYLMVGLVTLLRYRLWRFFHYLAVIVIVILTLGLMKLIMGTPGAYSPVYFFPLIFSLAVLIFANIFIVLETSTLRRPPEAGDLP